ncbi:hypothetical protein [Mycobacterium sp. 852002-51971_SCH5477799-a]|nr:hypothetical protein [Mycobacterium sp. 852002-51971_SCH5477799-a]
MVAPVQEFARFVVLRAGDAGYGASWCSVRFDGGAGSLVAGVGID